MEVKKVKTISGMTDFANLFLASYALKTQGEDNKVYLSRYFKSTMSSIFEDLLTHDSTYEYNLIHDGDNMLDIEEFMSKVKISTVKKYWRDDFTYDLERDCLVTEIEKKRAEEELNKYDENSLNYVDDVVNCYIRVSNEFDELGNDIVKKLRYYL